MARFDPVEAELAEMYGMNTKEYGIAYLILASG
jgi:hypothetical protein